MRDNSVLFFIMEYGAIFIANYCGTFLGVILSIAAMISGYRYRNINLTHGWIMTILAGIMLLCQF